MDGPVDILLQYFKTTRTTITHCLGWTEAMRGRSQETLTLQTLLLSPSFPSNCQSKKNAAHRNVCLRLQCHSSLPVAVRCRYLRFIFQ